MKRITSPPLVATAFLMVASMLVGVSAADAQTISGIVVPGSANPFLAGMPDGATASGDTAPAQSPTQINGLGVSLGGYLTFAVTGSVSFTPDPSGNPPDGGFDVSKGAENGISGYNAPANALVGIFLDDTQPSLSPAPVSLNFTGGGGIGITFATLSPALKQTFFIGDGLTGSGAGTVQQFNIPTGAQRLFLGTVDGSGWFNNSGQFNVSATRVGAVAVPEAGALPLAVLGLVGAFVIGRRRK